MPIPAALAALFDEPASADVVLRRAMALYAAAIRAERCLLFIFRPTEQLSYCSHGWWALPEYAYPVELTWQPVPASLAKDDPLFAEALRNPAALYIDDIETAGAGVLNLKFERIYFRHRALIHAPIYHKGEMIGILEPCTFGPPHRWSATDRVITAWLQERLAPVVAEYIDQAANTQ